MIYWGDCLDVMPVFIEDGTVDSCVTSPPYWGLRDYGVTGQIGLEETPEQFVEKMVQVFREVRRVLKKDGTLWLNLGDSYAAPAKNRSEAQAIARSTLGGGFTSAKNCLKQQSKITEGLKSKDLVGIPWRVAFALQADGWYLRQDIIWHKRNPMPESVQDRCTKSHEYIFLLTKSSHYYYDNDAIREPSKYPGGPNSPQSIKSPYGQGFARESAKRARDKIREEGLVKGMRTSSRWTNPKGKNKRSVWSVSAKPFKGAHFATFPPDLIEPCILAGSKPGGLILDPFFGAGTTGLVATKHGRRFVGIELNREYIAIASERLGVNL